MAAPFESRKEGTIMTVTIPDTHLYLMTQPIHAHVVTLMPDGTPQASVVWRLWEDPFILISSPKATQKTRNVTRDPRITFLMTDPQDPYRNLEIRGSVTEVRADPDYICLERITQFYTQKPYYGGLEPIGNRGTTDHVIFHVVPQKVNIH
jgi:PPOX class probable F420-dependent enzyme